eukprot:gene16551-7975_t
MGYLHSIMPTISTALSTVTNFTNFSFNLLTISNGPTQLSALPSSVSTAIPHWSTISTLPTASRKTNTTEKPEEISIMAIHFLGFFLILLAVLAIIGNFILMAIIIFVRKLHSKTHIFIVDLTVSDILVAVTVMPIDIDRLIRRKFLHDVVTCEFVSVMFFMSLPAAALSLSLLTLERYITLRYPLTHLKILTRYRIVGALVVKWVYVIIVASLPAMGWVYRPTTVDKNCNLYFTIQYAVFMVTANFILPLIIILAANIEIFRIANSAALKMRKSTRRNEKRRASLITIGGNVKAAKRIMLLVGLFLISWVPYITNTIVCMVLRTCHSPLALCIVLTLNFSSTAMNPILYGLLNKDVRHEIRKILRELSMKCTKNSFDKPFQRASHADYSYSVSVATDREVLNAKDAAHETTF